LERNQLGNHKVGGSGKRYRTHSKLQKKGHGKGEEKTGVDIGGERWGVVKNKKPKGETIIPKKILKSTTKKLDFRQSKSNVVGRKPITKRSWDSKKRGLFSFRVEHIKWGKFRGQTRGCLAKQ